MAVTQGIAVAWGCGLSTASAVGQIISQGETYKVDADKSEIKSQFGEIVSAYWNNYRKSLSVKCYNYNSTTMNATPQPGDGCTVTVDSTLGDSEFEEDWIVDSCSKERSIDGIGSFSLELIKYDGITTTV